MVSIGCIQGQAEGLREQLVLVPISDGIPQDVLESFRIQESQEDLQGLHLSPDWEQLTPLFSREMREFLPAHLSEIKGDAFLGALEVDRMEDCPVVEMEGDMEVVDTEFECRD